MHDMIYQYQMNAIDCEEYAKIVDLENTIILN